MKERGILFSAPMVLALLAGTKTQTRRIVNVPDPLHDLVKVESVRLHPEFGWAGYTSDVSRATPWFRCPYGAPGDRLWVRETFAANVPGCEEQGGYSYRADRRDPRGDGHAHPMKWTPCLLMPRKASRITLEITDVRVERLQAITEEDARAEGVMTGEMLPATINGEPGQVMIFSPITAYAVLWNSINGKKCPWSSNPWVWALTFRGLP